MGGAARAGCTARKEWSSPNNEARGYWKTEEWSSGDAPSVAGPFVKLEITQNRAGASTNCSSKPDSIKYYPATPTGICIRDGTEESIKIMADGKGGGRILSYGRRRRASADCSSTPTGEIVSSASFPPSPPPPPPPPATFKTSYALKWSPFTPATFTWKSGSPTGWSNTSFTA